eukprot:6200800-Pleurochrysis_carterae.AAC.1
MKLRLIWGLRKGCVKNSDLCASSVDRPSPCEGATTIHAMFTNTPVRPCPLLIKRDGTLDTARGLLSSQRDSVAHNAESYG